MILVLMTLIGFVKIVEHTPATIEDMIADIHSLSTSIVRY